MIKYHIQHNLRRIQVVGHTAESEDMRNIDTIKVCNSVSVLSYFVYVFVEENLKHRYVTRNTYEKGRYDLSIVGVTPEIIHVLEIYSAQLQEIERQHPELLERVHILQ
jgi:uncharacterized protein YsxB (DUF464 family)